MYLTSLTVRNLKRLREFHLDLTEGGEPRMWTVIIGENGTAKTSLLHAIALAAAGSKQLSLLAKPVVAHLRDRRADETLEIDAHFEFSEGSRSQREFHPLAPPQLRRFGLRSRVSLPPKSTSLSGSANYVDRASKDLSQAGVEDPLDRAREFHTPRWFVAAYGVSRALPESAFDPPLELPSIERLEPLFKPGARLASTSFANHFLRRDVLHGRRRGTTSHRYGRMLNKAIKLGGDDVLPDIQKIELRGYGGAKTSADLIESDRFHQAMGRSTQKMAGVALSHGYQSTFAWIADLIGHVLLEAEEELDTTEMEGLVLLDEIDLYLHPKWQATFITGLRRVFPRMQFVATTHSPVVLADLRPEEIVRLGADPDTGDVEVIPDGGDPRPMTGSEIYRQWFGIDRLTPNPHGAVLREYLVLAGDPFRSDRDERRLHDLGLALDRASIGDRPSPVSRKKAGGGGS